VVPDDRLLSQQPIPVSEIFIENFCRRDREGGHSSHDFIFFQPLMAVPLLFSGLGASWPRI